MTSRNAARAAVLTLAMLLLGACGSAARGYLDTKKLEPAAARLLEQRLMRSSPRQAGAATPTHVKRIDCRKVAARDFRCHAVLGDGSEISVPVRVSADGSRFRFH